jgi:hypothetical protein
VNESENPQRFVAYLCERPSTAGSQWYSTFCRTDAADALARRNRADEVGEGKGEETKFDHAHTAVALIQRVRGFKSLAAHPL